MKEEVKQAIKDLREAVDLCNNARCRADRFNNGHFFYDVARKNVPILLEYLEKEDKNV